MTASNDLLESLKANINRLLDRNRMNEKANGLLKQEIEQLRNNLKEKEAVHEELMLKYKTLQVAKTLVGESGSSQEVKANIHNLVREIDKCIALLNR